MIPAEEKLDRALVAGLLLEISLETTAVPVNPEIRQRAIKSRLTYAMVRHLAGRVTLDRFRTLVHRLHVWFPFYYPLMPPLPKLNDEQEPLARIAAPPRPRPVSLVRQARLKEWLERAARQILPKRPQSKLQAERLEDFCRLSQYSWFRVKDFAQYFRIDRKTAWEYTQKLQEAGLLLHNQRRSAAARYRLADRFLKIKLTALEKEVALALTNLPISAAAEVAQALAATAGEPFWGEHWPVSSAASHREKITALLNQAGILEVVCHAGKRRMWRLSHCWLQSQEF
jgi:hypothetical protein